METEMYPFTEHYLLVKHFKCKKIVNTNHEKLVSKSTQNIQRHALFYISQTRVTSSHQEEKYVKLMIYFAFKFPYSE